MLHLKITKIDWLHNSDKKQWTSELEKENIKYFKISYLPLNKILTALRMIRGGWKKIIKAELKQTLIWYHPLDKRSTIKKAS